MDKRKVMLIIIIVLIIAMGVVVYFFLTREQKSTPAPDLGGGGGSVFGSSSDTPSNASITSTTNTPTEDNIQKILPRLRQLTAAPTSGDIVISKQVDVIRDRVKVKETQYFVRYMDRATGHIFDIKTDSPAAQEISNTTIPKVYEANFVPDGSAVMTRFLSDVNPDQIITYFVTLKDKKAATSTSATSTSTTKTAGEISDAGKTSFKDVSGVYLPPDIKEFTLSPSGAKALSLFYTNTGGKISISNANGTSERAVLLHPLREWQIAMPSESKAVLTTKPSGLVNGFAYSLDLASGNLTKIMGGVAGLTVLPNKDGTAYLGAGSPGGVVKLFSYIVKGEKQTILSLSTLPEKCVWANKDKLVAYCAVPQSMPNSTYPDVWYQGRISFVDDIWKINVSTGETNLISSLQKESGQNIDATNMKLSDDDTYLTFINKSDLTLWGLDLTKNK